MDAGGLAQMSHANNFAPPTMSMRPGGLASRRGGQGVAPLSFDALKSPTTTVEPSAPTPRTTARSHLLAGLRTAPKSATATTFAASGTIGGIPTQARNRNSMGGVYGHDALNGPKTSVPRGYGLQQQQQQAFAGYAQQQQQQQQQAAQAQAQAKAQAQAQAQAQLQQQQLYTADQILAPPEIHIEDQSPEHMDPAVYANLVSTNLYLAQQQQRLQQQLMSLQAAQQQFQNLNLGGQAAYQALYQQQQQQQQQQAQLNMLMQGMATGQGTIYTVYDPTTGQNSYFLDQSTSQNAHYDQFNAGFQHQQAPRVQVSPPPAEFNQPTFRNSSPPRRFESPDQHTPLPPPSANAFRRGHKKSTSMSNGSASLSVAVNESASKSPGPKTANFPLTPLTGGYGPGQARAGEHPVRQPRGPPSFDELRTKPTSKHEGSKNFAGRTRRSALSNLVRAGITRRQVTSTGSSGSISPISESAEEQLPTPLTEDDESVSGRSGSGSLNGDDVDCSPPSSRTSTGSWGAIGSDRPSSRQKARQQSVDSVSNASDNETSTAGGSSFASIFKGAAKPQGTETSGQRKAPMLVLNRAAEKRKPGLGSVAAA